MCLLACGHTQCVCVGVCLCVFVQVHVHVYVFHVYAHMHTVTLPHERLYRITSRFLCIQLCVVEYFT